MPRKKRDVENHIIDEDHGILSGVIKGKLIDVPFWDDDLWKVDTLGCGGCDNNTTLSSKYTCRKCGRMLCGKCGDLCDYHRKEKEQADGSPI